MNPTLRNILHGAAIFSAASVVAFTLFVQPSRGEDAAKPAAAPENPEVASWKRVKDQAASYGDGLTVLVALNQLVANDTEAERPKWKLELARVFMSQNNVRGTNLIATELRGLPGGKWDTLETREMQALSRQALGLRKEAAESWKAVVATEGATPIHLTKYAGFLIEGNELDEASSLVKKALGEKATDGLKIVMPTQKQGPQEIPLKAALHNMEGIIAMKREPKDEKLAKESLAKALEIAPEFQIAKLNLEQLSQPAPSVPEVAPEKK